ncbi:hypothetical protein HHK36_008596 [Tetracentron sinense]|uniref:VOC domain-containing protein n=1 Tax=Tetracentron sinense TaxID=13715 RepID=A0A834ZQF4_TETSI|nr:hypothetical protein HHK36_008596 [Tetracentron sinense]
MDFNGRWSLDFLRWSPPTRLSWSSSYLLLEVFTFEVSGRFQETLVISDLRQLFLQCSSDRVRIESSEMLVDFLTKFVFSAASPYLDEDFCHSGHALMLSEIQELSVSGLRRKLEKHALEELMKRRLEDRKVEKKQIVITTHESSRSITQSYREGKRAIEKAKESVKISVRFYEEVLGFVLIKRPSSFTFHGAWLFNYGVGIHLLENTSICAYDTGNVSRPINPKDNHISFQCTDVELVKMRLQEMGMKYVTAVVEEGGIKVDQVFFHDPDGHMIEICNCDNLPILPLVSCPLKPKEIVCKNMVDKCGLMENVMMESLSMEMMNMSF